jgi:hypothetical protein
MPTAFLIFRTATVKPPVGLTKVRPPFLKQPNQCTRTQNEKSRELTLSQTTGGLQVNLINSRMPESASRNWARVVSLLLPQRRLRSLLSLPSR